MVPVDKWELSRLGGGGINGSCATRVIARERSSLLAKEQAYTLRKTFRIDSPFKAMRTEL